MINVIIADDDSFYRQGIELLLKQIFNVKLQREVSFIYILDSAEIAKANIIVKHAQPGEIDVCQPMYLNRKDDSMMVLIYDKHKPSGRNKLLLCFERNIFISRTDSLNKVRRLIEYGWNKTKFYPPSYCKKTCNACRPYDFSLQQEKIASYIYGGQSPAQISGIMGINQKVVSAHKRRIMQKFNISNDNELINFLGFLKTNSLL